MRSVETGGNATLSGESCDCADRFARGPLTMTVAGRSRHGVNCMAATPFGDPLLQSATS